MKINAEFQGFPLAYDIVGEKKLGLEISGNTVNDVIEELIRRYGEKLRNAFYDSQENFNPTVQIALNSKCFVPTDKHDTRLEEGDTLLFMVLFDGG